MVEIEDGFIVVQPDMHPTHKEIEEIKKSLGENDTFDDKELKKMKEERLKSGLNKIVLGHLFIRCIDNIKNNLNRVKLKEKKIINAKNKLSDYLKKVDNKCLRNLIEDFNNGESYGSYYTGLKIKDIVEEDKADMDLVISIFFDIFEEDE